MDKGKRTQLNFNQHNFNQLKFAPNLNLTSLSSEGKSITENHNRRKINYREPQPKENQLQRQNPNPRQAKENQLQRTPTGVKRRKINYREPQPESSEGKSITENPNRRKINYREPQPKENQLQNQEGNEHNLILINIILINLNSHLT